MSEGTREKFLKGEVRVIERPEDLTDELASKLTECAKSVFDDDAEIGKSLNVRSRYESILSKGGKIWYVLGEDDSIAAFLSSRVDEDGDLNFSTAAVREEYRGRGLYQKLTYESFSYALSRSVPRIFLSTASPRIELGVRKNLDKFQEDGMIKAYAICRWPISFIGRKPAVKGSQQKSGNQELDEVYAALDYQQGEAFRVRVDIEYPEKNS